MNFEIELNPLNPGNRALHELQIELRYVTKAKKENSFVTVFGLRKTDPSAFEIVQEIPKRIDGLVDDCGCEKLMVRNYCGNCYGGKIVVAGPEYETEVPFELAKIAFGIRNMMEKLKRVVEEIGPLEIDWRIRGIVWAGWNLKDMVLCSSIKEGKRGRK